MQQQVGDSPINSIALSRSHSSFGWQLFLPIAGRCIHILYSYTFYIERTDSRAKAVEMKYSMLLCALYMRECARVCISFTVAFSRAYGHVCIALCRRADEQPCSRARTPGF